MNEHDFETRLNAYIDGELSPEEAARFEAELADDADAAAEAEALRNLLDQASALPREIEPPRDAWADIEARLTPRKSNVIRVNFARWSMALATFAAMALFGVWTLNRAPETTSPAAAPSPAGPPSAVLAHYEEYREAERSYQQAREGLMDALSERETQLHPETRAVLDENLEIIDGAMDQIMAAMERDPENPMLVRKLMATREKELSLLEQMLYVPEGV